MNLIPPRHGLFGCRTSTPEVVEIGILGLPCDTGLLGDKSTARAPTTLRHVSRAFSSTFDESGKGIGWWDYDTQRLLLENISWCDFGDAEMSRRLGASQLEEIPDLVETLLPRCQILLVLGGDHSVTHYLCKNARRPLLVIDAHEDATRISGQHPHHGNWISATEREHADLHIAQLGLRGIVPNRRSLPGPRRTILNGRDAIAGWIYANGIEEVHISVDVDILDPSLLRSVSAPSPMGWSCVELAEAIDFIASHTRIRLIDVVEFCPIGEHGWYESALLLFLFLRMLDSAVSRCRTTL